MKRRELIILLGGLAIWSGAAPAQPPDRVRRIGILMGIADDFEGQTRIAVFRQALQGLGWIEGRNVQLIYRWLLFARAVENAASSLSIKPFAAAVHDADVIERVIKQIARESDSALLVLPDLFTATNRESIIALAARYRLPAIYPFRYFAVSGGLMSYGTEVLDTYRQAASYVDRILKGEKPGDLPVQQPTKFEFVINLTAAKAIGLDVSPRAPTR